MQIEESGRPIGEAVDVHAQRRAEMVERQLRARGIADEGVLAAMGRVPRETFVLQGLEPAAYDDRPLPIAAGQTISQPYVVARMLEAARIRPGDRVLEVGLGSGYAAAVMSRIAERVYAMDRHPDLVEQAERTLRSLGCHNVQVGIGDGSVGWVEMAPFDVIVVSAGAPSVPEGLRSQLAIGGRLVIPVGGTDMQDLLVIERRGDGDYSCTELGGVHFVPLVGSQGWRPDGLAPADPAALLARAARPLAPPSAPRFAEAFDFLGDARIVCIGEASHGTHEFYASRAAITRHLIERHGVRFVALEADWPDAAVLDRIVRQRPGGGDEEDAFARFPTWMWRNREVAEFVGWLRDHNAALPPDERVALHGLDLYSLNASIRAVVAYLEGVDPAAAALARERYACFQPWQHNPATYGRQSVGEGLALCEEAVLSQLRDLFARSRDYAAQDGEDYLDARQNAQLIASAETYYRALYRGSAQSWNLRDEHMFDTFLSLTERHGPDARAIVWAHNSHIGDARHTDMRRRGEHNLGQLLRERFGAEVRLVGQGTHRGRVAAASDWGGPMEMKPVTPSAEGSIERLCHDAAVPRFLIDLRRADEAVRELLSKPLLERYIGVIYRPESERLSHYAVVQLAQEYDAWIWFDETGPVDPLPVETRAAGRDTFPFGL
ncbi:protein-L-isoaspartate(D-aspartate) O-methyltransferase [Novosphingobium sp. BL-8A]|uniref:protein-L-isoaspartate(D-aspartate) O-methyltransferase n=1 Tax=Novosphingobium sp. BL-8A TaxID=3127639 RepID=UPI003756ED5F